MGGREVSGGWCSGGRLSDLAEAINPQVRGWINYYGTFYAPTCVPSRIDEMPPRIFLRNGANRSVLMAKLDVVRLGGTDRCMFTVAVGIMRGVENRWRNQCAVREPSPPRSTPKRRSSDGLYHGTRARPWNASTDGEPMRHPDGSGLANALDADTPFVSEA
jgi:hypothetical protein